MYISDHRFKVLHEKHSIEWFLVIKAVTYKDQGVYECQVNSDPYKTFKYHLSVVGEYLCNQGVWLEYSLWWKIVVLIYNCDQNSMVTK